MIPRVPSRAVAVTMAGLILVVSSVATRAAVSARHHVQPRLWPAAETQDSPGTTEKPITGDGDDTGTAGTGTPPVKPPSGRPTPKPAASAAPSRPMAPLPALAPAPTMETTQPIAIFDFDTDRAGDAPVGIEAADELSRQLRTAGIEIKTRQQLQEAAVDKSVLAVTRGATTALANQRAIAVAVGAGSMIVGSLRTVMAGRGAARVAVELRQLNPVSGAVLNSVTATESLVSASVKNPRGGPAQQSLNDAVKRALAAGLLMLQRTRK